MAGEPSSFPSLTQADPPPSVRRQKRTAARNAARGKLKLLEGGKDGLLIGRGEYKKNYDLLHSGSTDSCLADAVAHGLGVDKVAVRRGIGFDHSFARAATYVCQAHPGWALLKCTGKFMQPGGIEQALLNASTGRFVLSMSYQVNSNFLQKFFC